MQWYEILLIVVASVFVVGVTVWRMIRLKQGKGCDCDGGCSHCSHCSTCQNKKEKK